MFKQKVNKNQVLQYVALYYYHNIIQNKEVPFDVLKEIFAILFKKQKNKLFTDKELNIKEIEKPFTFLHYPASTYCPDINAFPNKNIHQLCKDKSKAMEFYYLDDNKN
ncbi:MAG: hypothetical protein WA945_11020 [Arcobacteraceae bacterium]